MIFSKVDREGLPLPLSIFLMVEMAKEVAGLIKLQIKGGIRHHLGDYLSEEDEIEEIPFIGIFRYLGRLLTEKCG